MRGRHPDRPSGLALDMTYMTLRRMAARSNPEHGARLSVLDRASRMVEVEIRHRFHPGRLARIRDRALDEGLTVP